MRAAHLLDRRLNPAPIDGLVSLALPLALLPAQACAPEKCAPPPVSDVVVNVKDKGAVGDGRR
jgi:hypothetical protein